MQKNENLNIHLINDFNLKKRGNILITSSSFEERCLGSLNKIDGNEFQKAIIFTYEEPSEDRDKNLKKQKQKLNSLTQNGFEEIFTSSKNPLKGLDEFAQYLKNYSPKSTALTIDISTFTKRHMLLLVKTIEEHGFWENTTILYTEPLDYITNLFLPLSMGISSISTIPGFVSNTPSNLPLFLLIFLGYEGDRAYSLHSKMSPNTTKLIIPDPPYREEWRGRTKKMNKHLIKILGENKLDTAHSLDPYQVKKKLYELEKEHNFDKEKWVLSPLGTKPQTFGIYLFWRENKHSFSIVYASPLKHNVRFYSTGIGNTWVLK